MPVVRPFAGRASFRLLIAVCALPFAALSCERGASEEPRDADPDGATSDARPEPCESGAPESCDGVDNDGNGVVDDPDADGCVYYLADQDDDGYGAAGSARCLCAPEGPYGTTQPGDCDDAIAGVNPGAVETCDGADDDCDGAVDEEGAVGCTAWLADRDGDGYGVDGDEGCLCGPSGALRALLGGDCADEDGAVYPDAAEVCNGRDDDCDGETDEAGAFSCLEYYADADGDGYGAAPGRCLCAPVAGHEAREAGDCDDRDGAVHPLASEVCDGVDDDCDGTTDEGFEATCVPLDSDDDGVPDAADDCPDDPDPEQEDLDGDGAGDVCDEDDDGDGVEDALDCAPYDGTVAPGGRERCDGRDDDCDGETDEGFSVGAPCEVGVGECRSPGFLACDAGTGTTRCNIEPFAPSDEVCNGLDDDCDGASDEGMICADPAVRNTLAYDGGVRYVTGTATCGENRVVQFWPEWSTADERAGFECHASWWQFRRTDGELFYSAVFSSIWQHDPGGPELPVPTPPCESAGPFGFDAAGRLYYRCGGTLRRGNGEILHASIDGLVTVLGDGRAVVTRGTAEYGSTPPLVVLSASGQPLPTPDPRQDWDGTFLLLPSGTTVVGDDAFVLFRRTFGEARMELVAFRLDPTSTWLPVRRLAVGAWPRDALVVPDGSLFVMEPDETTTFDMQFRLVAPDGTSAVVWREAEMEYPYQLHIAQQFLAAPRVP